MSENTLISLPLEIVIKICSFLKLSDLLNLMLTCQKIKDLLVNESALWRVIANKRFIIINKSDKNLYSWYNQCRIFRNWCKGIYKTKVIVQHRINYMPWLYYDNSENLYLSVGSELRCYKLDRRGIPRNGLSWCLEVPKVKRFDVRTNDISRFIVKDDIIVCGNRDGCVAVYQFEDNKSKPKLLIHIKDCHERGVEEVSAVEKIGNTIVTGSNKSESICFWQLANVENDCSSQLYPKSSYVSCLDEYYLDNETCCRSIAANHAGDTLAIGPTGSDKPMILDVNTRTMTLYSSLNNAAKVVRDVQWLNENSVAYVTYTGKLEVLDTRCSDVVYHTTDPFMSSLYCLRTDGCNTIVTGTSEYARCVLYDLRSKYHVQMYFTQKKSSPVYCLDFDSSKLIAAADRGVATINFNIKNSLTCKDYSQRFEFVQR